MPSLAFSGVIQVVIFKNSSKFASLNQKTNMSWGTELWVRIFTFVLTWYFLSYLFLCVTLLLISRDKGREGSLEEIQYHFNANLMHKIHYCCLLVSVLQGKSRPLQFILQCYSMYLSTTLHSKRHSVFLLKHCAQVEFMQRCTQRFSILGEMCHMQMSSVTQYMNKYEYE